MFSQVENVAVLLRSDVEVGISLSLSFSRSFTFCSRCRFVSRRDFQYMEMDTDSVYMALSDELEKIVRPEYVRM